MFFVQALIVFCGYASGSLDLLVAITDSVIMHDDFSSTGIHLRATLMSLTLSMSLAIAATVTVSVNADVRFDTQIEKVRELRRDRKFDDAVALADQLLREYPDNAVAISDRGDVLLEAGRYEEAMKDIAKACKLDPTDIPSLKRRALCSVHLHNYKDALADYTRVIQLVPNDGSAYFDRAVLYAKMGDKNAANADKQRATDHGCPEGSMQALDRARQMYYSGKFQAAGQALTLLEQHGCRLPDLYIIRGRCRLAEESFQPAAEDFSRAMQIHPNIALFLVRAGVYLNMENYEAALADCNKVIEKHPLYLMTRVIQPDGRPKKINVLFEAYRERVEAYRALGRFDKAFDDCTASLQEWPNRIETLEQRADLAKRLKRPQIAAADFQRAIKLDPSNTDSWFGLAQSYSDMKQYDNAVIICNKYLSAFPNDDDGYVLRGDFYMALGKTAKAVDDYSRAVSLAGDNASLALRKRAEAYLKIGDKNRAEADMKESERLNSDRPSAPAAVAPANRHQKPVLNKQ
jgi:tetratricopeptide (TPR) repeat protein